MEEIEDKYETEKKIFKNYYNDTDDIFLRFKKGWGGFKPINSFLIFKNFETNEEFWV